MDRFEYEFRQARNAGVRVLAAAILSTCAAFPVFAQTFNEIGELEDTQPTNAAVYGFPALPPGIFSLTAERSRFDAGLRRSIGPQVQQTATFDLALPADRSSGAVVAAAPNLPRNTEKENAGKTDILAPSLDSPQELPGGRAARPIDASAKPGGIRPHPDVISGNAILIYVISGNQIEVFDSAGNFQFQFGGTGSGNGQFMLPSAITVDSSGNVWVVDATLNRVQKFDACGNFLLQFGSTGTAPGFLYQAYGIAVDANGNVWIAEEGNSRIQQFSGTGMFLQAIGGLGGGNGQFNGPVGIAIDSSNNIWVADTGNNRVQKFSAVLNGAGVASTVTFLLKFGTLGNANGQFNGPFGISVDLSGNVWVANSLNQRLQEFNSGGGFIQTVGPFSYPSPYSVAVDNMGDTWAVDSNTNQVIAFNSSNGARIFSFGTTGGGPTQLFQPTYLAVGSAQNLTTCKPLKIIGGDPPTKCDTCKCPGSACSQRSNTSSTISKTEGNLKERVPVSTTRSSAGATTDLAAMYNSYNADGSRATVDTVMGYGWTHSYNIFLFNQFGAMFRYDADGRVTKFGAGPGGTYITSTGYFETLVKNLSGTFTITQKDQTIYNFALVPFTPFLVFGPVWRLISIIDRNGNTTTLNYSAGNLASVTDTYGRTTSFSYNTQGKLISVTDPLSRTTTFSYDSTGHQLTRITDPTGKTTQYTYNSLYQLTSKIDRDGRLFTYVYSNNEPISVYDGVGQSPGILSNPGNWATDPAQHGGAGGTLFVRRVWLRHGDRRPLQPRSPELVGNAA